MEITKLKNSKSQIRKLERKLRKFQHLIHRETFAECNLVPSKNLAICNAGLVSGLTEEVVYKHFSKIGSLENIVLIPGKSFSFVSYKDEKSAEQAFEKYNGKLKIAQDDKPIYLLYVSTLPPVEVEKSWSEVPPGLIILEDFVTPEEENLILNLCNFKKNNDFNTGQMRHREVRHFGFEFKYDTNDVDKTDPLNQPVPSECNFLWERLHDTELPFKNFVPDQLTVNHYLPGQGIPSHVDTHSPFEDPIVCLSLQSAVVMEFKKDNKNACVLLPTRSLCIMSNESRYAWTHGITPRKYDVIKTESGYSSLERETRVSFTFRKLRNGPCTCIYKGKCDSPVEQTEIKENSAVQLEKLHVHEVYENIAAHFSDTRHKPWPNVLSFVQSFKTGTILVDIGCGNGKYLGINKSIFDIGCDTSFGLLNVCKQRKFETSAANCLNIPFKDNSTDGVICIAVIHHLANEERRLKAVSEIVRVLKIEGKALIYVWAKDQLQNREKSSYIKQDRKNRKSNVESIAAETTEEVAVVEGLHLPVHTNRTQFQHKDLLVPWKLKNETEETFLRYYHVFDKNELEILCKKLNNIEIVRSYYDQGNWCVVIKKTIK